jgi:hypothetical protein
MQSDVKLHRKEKKMQSDRESETKAKGLGLYWQTPGFILSNIDLFEYCSCSDQLTFEEG